MQWTVKKKKKTVPQTPVEPGIVHTTLSHQMLAQIVRDEIQHGIAPLGSQMVSLNTTLSSRLDAVEGRWKTQDSNWQIGGVSEYNDVRHQHA